MNSQLQHPATGSAQGKPTANPSSQAAPSARPTPAYRTRLARIAADVQAAQALRFEVFNLELNEGLLQSYDTGLDADPYDAVCDHLLVEDESDGSVVGTYRLQTGLRAQQALGYYSEREFDFSPLEHARPQMLELGRACIHLRHRNFTVLNLLWKGIAAYAHNHGARYLVGCSSLTTQDEASGAAAFVRLQSHLAPAAWQTVPKARFALHAAAADGAAPVPRIPRLLSTYLALGACICGPPAIDREFHTIDFLTWLDVHLPAVVALQARGRFTA